MRILGEHLSKHQVAIGNAVLEIVEPYVLPSSFNGTRHSMLPTNMTTKEIGRMTGLHPNRVNSVLHDEHPALDGGKESLQTTYKLENGMEMVVHVTDSRGTRQSRPKRAERISGYKHHGTNIRAMETHMNNFRIEGWRVLVAFSETARV